MLRCVRFDVSAASLPLVSPVLISTESSGQVEGAVGSQTGVHPLGEVEDLGGRESFPLTLFSLQPTLAATGCALLSAPVEERTLSAPYPRIPGVESLTTGLD